MIKHARIAAMAAAAVVGAALASTSAEAADSNCWLQASPGTTPSGMRQWQSSPYYATTIFVYVATSSTAGVQRSDYNASNVALATQTALERWNEQAGTTLRLAWGGLTNNDSVPGGILVQGLGTCSNKVARASPGPGTGFITEATITLARFGKNGPDCDPTWVYAQRTYPAELVDILVHELGHTMGRHDAYDLLTCQPNACGTAHATIMTCAVGQDLTDFDRTDHQSVYGNRAQFARLQHRTFSTSWGGIVDDGPGDWEVRAGSGSSYQHFVMPVPIVQRPNPRLSVLRWRYDYDWDLPEVFTPAPATRRPVSASYSTTGTGIMAYVVEGSTVGARFKVCHRLRNANGTWGGESCIDPSSFTTCSTIGREGVSTAYDPISGRFLVVNGCASSNIEGVLVRSIPQPSCVFNCLSASAFVRMTPAEGAAIACSDYQALGEPLRANCRLVWADRGVYGQPIMWKTIGVTPDPAVIVGSATLTAPGLFSDHAPSVTWFKGNFRMGVIRFGRDIDLYKMLPTSSTTSWSFERRLNSTGWVSPPTLSPTRGCVASSCTDRLTAFWLRYE